MEVNIRNSLLFILCLIGHEALGEDVASLDISIEFSTQTTLILGDEVTMTATILVPPGTDTILEFDIFNKENDSAVVFVYGPTSVDTSSLTYEPLATDRSVSPVRDEVYDSFYNKARVANSGVNNETLTLVFGMAIAEDLSEGQPTVRFAVAGMHNGTFYHVWSTEKEFTISTSQNSMPSYSGIIICDPASLEINYFSLCTANFSTSNRYVYPVSIQITVSNEASLLPNTFSIGSILDVERSGSHLEVPSDFVRSTSYAYDAEGFSSNATIDMGLVVKPSGTGNLAVKFALSAHKDDSYAGQAITLRAVLEVSGNHISATVTATVNTVASQGSESPLTASMLDIRVVGDNGSTVATIPSGGLFEYEVTVNTTGTSGKYNMYLLTQATDPDVTVCDITVHSRDFNTPFVFPPTAYADHLSGYSIHNTRQLIDPDSGIVKYRVLATHQGDAGASGQVDFKLEDETAVTSTGSVTVQGTGAPTHSFKFVNFSKSANVLERNRALSIKVVIESHVNSYYPNVRFLLIPEKNGSLDLPIRVCTPTIGNTTFPCVPFLSTVERRTRYFRNKNDSIYVNEFNDSVEAGVGSLNTLSTESFMEFMLVVSLPWGEPGVDYPPGDVNATEILYRIGVTIDDYSIWTDSVTFTLGGAAIIRSPYNLNGGAVEMPNVTIYPSNPDDAVVEDRPYNLVVEIKVGAGMTQDMDLLVYPPSGCELCRLSLKERGRYVSCIQGGDWYRGERFTWMNTSRLRYYDTQYANLTIFGLTNIGNQSISVTDNKYNSILVNVPVNILPGFGGGDITAKIQLTGSTDAPWKEDTYSLAAATSASAGSPTPSVRFSVTPTEYYVQRPNILEVEVQIPEGTAHEVTVTLTAPAATPICCTHVTFVGELMPCANGSLATHTISSDGTSAEVNLGKVCRVSQDVLDFADTDVIRVRAAFSPLLTATTSESFTAAVLYDGQSKSEVQSTSIGPGTTSVVDQAFANVTFGTFDKNETRIKENATAFLNVSIPSGVTIPVKLKLSAFPSVNRPSLTISNVQFVSVGKNLMCAESIIRDAISAVTISNYNSSHGDMKELDTIEIDLGVLSNTGFTQMTYNDVPEDNCFTISVDTVLNDAPWNDNASYVGVKLEVTSGADSVVTSGNATIQVLHIDTDLPVLNMSLRVEDPLKIYGRQDEVKIIFTVNHLNESMAETAIIEIVMYLPYGNYLSFNRTEAVGVQPINVRTTYDKSQLIAKVGHLRFFDTSEVSFYFKVNPDNNRHFGYQTYDLTVPYTITAKLSQRFHVGGFSRFPDNSTGRLPPVIDHLLVTIDSPVCSDDLYLSNATLFPDCLFTASSMLNNNFPPHFARITSTNPWVPRESGDKEYLQLDLGNLHMISKILYNGHNDNSNVKEVVIAASVDGQFWEDNINVTLPDLLGIIEQDLPRSLTGRYFRLYIISKYGTGSGVGLRFDFRGCALTKSVIAADVCDTLVPPPTSDAELENRHFAVDSTLDAAAFCAYSIDLGGNKCYVSRDYGVVWNDIPYHIDTIKGYHPLTAKLYASNSANQLYYYSTDGGLHWAPITKAMWINETQVASLVPSTAIPYSLNPPQQQIGNWPAKAEGILYGGNLVASWGACCSHNLE